jgi:mRNA interferase RelE/StbE
MRYQIDIPTNVRRQIDDLPGHIRQRVKRTIAALADDPLPSHAVEMRNTLQGYYKIRLDQHRIVYRVEDDILVVIVVKAGKKHTGFYSDLP